MTTTKSENKKGVRVISYKEQKITGGKIKYFKFRVKDVSGRALNNSVWDNLLDMSRIWFEVTGNNNLIPVIENLKVLKFQYEDDYVIIGSTNVKGVTFFYHFTYTNNPLDK